MSFYDVPQYFGIEDHTVDGAQPFSVRIYYPTDDDIIVGAPLPTGPQPLVVFAHGNRSGTQNSHLCPSDPAKDNCRWTLVLGALARSGFVVAAPALGQVAVEPSVERLAATVEWLRTMWHGRRMLHLPLELDPGFGGFPHGGNVESEVEERLAESHLPAVAANWHLPTLPLGEPTGLALVGHSWGARACAVLAARGAVKALAAVAGTFDDNLAISAIQSARIPTLLMCGTEDSQTFSFLDGLWPGLATPKYQAAFRDVGHWDWFGKGGAIRRCNGQSPPRPFTGHIAGELLAGFLTRHVARFGFPLPAHAFNPLMRPWGWLWYFSGNDLKVRWDAPGENFSPLPSTGDGLHGTWPNGTIPW